VTAVSNWQARDRSEESLFAAMADMAPPGIRLGCRTIRQGDEHLLLPDEQQAVTTRDLSGRRASGAARHLARGLLAGLGYPATAIGRERSGQPVWPRGIVGSLAHDDTMAVVAVASSSVAPSLGIDVEPSLPLPDDALSIVITADDDVGAVGHALAGRIAFAAKEAIYKATHPLDGIILNHDDIAINLIASHGRTRTGHFLKLFLCVSPRIVVFAIPAD